MFDVDMVGWPVKDSRGEPGKDAEAAEVSRQELRNAGVACMFALFALVVYNRAWRSSTMYPLLETPLSYVSYGYNKLKTESSTRTPYIECESHAQDKIYPPSLFANYCTWLTISCAFDKLSTICWQSFRLLTVYSDSLSNSSSSSVLYMFVRSSPCMFSFVQDTRFNIMALGTMSIIVRRTMLKYEVIKSSDKRLASKAL